MNLPSNSSFTGGTIAHEVVQMALCENKTIEEILE